MTSPPGSGPRKPQPLKAALNLGVELATALAGRMRTRILDARAA